jgi:hypothetical protein
VPERHNIFKNPFRPFAEQITPDNRISNLEQRAEKAETALHAARRDLAAERERTGLAAEVDVEAARREERKRIDAIMSSPVAPLMPEVAYTFAFKTQTPRGRSDRNNGSVGERIAGGRHESDGGQDRCGAEG